MRRYILGFFTAAAAAAALWLLHRTFPCPLTALLAPANGSPWEMGKLLFWPYLPAALVIWRLSPERGSRGGHCLLLAVMPEAENEVKATAAEFGIELTAIGELVPARAGRAMVEIR